VVRNRKDQNGRSRYNGQVAFNTSAASTTGTAFADALLGNFQSYTEHRMTPLGTSDSRTSKRMFTIPGKLRAGSASSLA